MQTSQPAQNEASAVDSSFDDAATSADTPELSSAVEETARATEVPSEVAATSDVQSPARLAN